MYTVSNLLFSYGRSNNDLTTPSAPINGITLSDTSSNTPCFAVAAFLTLRTRQSKVVIKLAATTLGVPKLLIGTSVGALRILELIGQQIKSPIALLYALPDNTSAGRYFPISLPFVVRNQAKRCYYDQAHIWPR